MANEDVIDPAAGVVVREAPEIPEARAALVKKLCKEIAADKKHWEKPFKVMREDIKFARDGGIWDGASERYTVNIVLRHLKNAVSNLYAKNPRASAKRRERLEFSVWDGKKESLEAAIMAAQDTLMTGMPIDPGTHELLQDVITAGQRTQMLDKLGKTLELNFNYALTESQPRFKIQAKSLVRRTSSTGVGYVKLGFQREMQKTPDAEARLLDVTERLATIERLSADLADGEIDTNSAEAEQLRLTQAAIEAEPEIILREGLTFSFPKSTSIIPDRRCYQLQGFLGAGRVTQEYMLTPEEVQETYGIDIGAKFSAYKAGKDGTYTQTSVSGAASSEEERLCCVWQCYEKKSGLVYSMVEGYPDFVDEPAAPKVKVERFWPIYTLTFNDVEDDENIFPPSDVRLLRSMQIEMNRSRDALSDHRKAATPFNLSSAGSLTDEDKTAIRERTAHEIVDIKGLPPGTDAAKIVQPFPTNPIDPNLYQTNHVMEDSQIAVGASEAASYGSTGGDSATENSIAESSRVRSVTSNIDDLDDLLTELAHDGGHILLMNLSAEKAKEIAGPGAVWPTMTRSEIAKDLFLDIKAGSSGKPNKAQELANIERVAPYLLQTGNIKPMWLAELLVKAIDEGIDLKEAILEGLPSMQAMNTMMKSAQGGPGVGHNGGPPLSDQPGDQGDQGGANAEKPQQTAPGAQPAYPAGNGPGISLAG